MTGSGVIRRADVEEAGYGFACNPPHGLNRYSAAAGVAIKAVTIAIIIVLMKLPRSPCRRFFERHCYARGRCRAFPKNSQPYNYGLLRCFF